MYLFLIISLFYLGARCQDNIQSKFMSERVLCDVDERLVRGCSSQVGTIRSSTECVSLCSRDTSCIGASIDENGLCFHHRECPLVSGCTVEDSNHRYLTKYCAHGTWNPSTHSCNCVDGFYGDKCNQCYSSCYQLLGAVGFGTGVHKVYIDPGQIEAPFQVWCFVDSSWSAVLILKNSGSMSFNKTWNEHVHGVFMDDTNFMIGLYALHRLTFAGCINMEMIFVFESRASTLVSQKYHSFSVSDETNKYSFTALDNGPYALGSVPAGSSFGDCLGPLQNRPFSTWDMDNDGDPSENCAARTGSGWWYGGCDSACNLLGFEPNYLATLPRHQIMSLPGMDMNIISSEEAYIEAYIHGC